MFAPDQYELIDFGDGRKLERFGPLVLDRPSPAADDAAPKHPQLWRDTTAAFHRLRGQQGDWQPADSLPPSWTVRHRSQRFELAPNATGQVGLFPEQAANWDWITGELDRARANDAEPLRLLNLFAYTGGSTLAAAAAGAHVTHVDAAAGVVARARRNAAASGLADAPIRWIVDDVRPFVRRERKRGNTYHALILDPPGYGHGPKGKPWHLDHDLADLIDDCAALLTADARFLLLTWHSADVTESAMRGHLSKLTATSDFDVTADDMALSTADRRTLNAGYYLRACRLLAN